MIRTADPFRIIHSERGFYVCAKKEVGRRVTEEGSLRSYMAAHLTVASFASHVAHCVQKQLLQFDRQTAIHFDFSQNVFHLYGYTQGKLFSLLLTFAEVEEWKAAGPYALDRYIFGELAEKGISLVHMTPYLRVVFSQS
jgi:hypothetical protein